MTLKIRVSGVGATRGGAKTPRDTKQRDKRKTAAVELGETSEVKHRVSGNRQVKLLRRALAGAAIRFALLKPFLARGLCRVGMVIGLATSRCGSDY
jgi:hypothetical protein